MNKRINYLIIKYVISALIFIGFIFINKCDIFAETINVNFNIEYIYGNENDQTVLETETWNVTSDDAFINHENLKYPYKKNYTFKKEFGVKNDSGEFVKTISATGNDYYKLVYSDWKVYINNGELNLYPIFEENYHIFLTVYKPDSSEIYVNSNGMSYDKYKVYFNNAGSFSFYRAGVCDDKAIDYWTYNGVNYYINTSISENDVPNEAEFVGHWKDIEVTLALGEGVTVDDGVSTTLLLKEYTDTITFPGKTKIHKDGYLLKGWSTSDSQAVWLDKDLIAREGDISYSKSKIGYDMTFYPIWGQSVKVKIYNLKTDTEPLAEGECFASSAIAEQNIPRPGVTIPPSKITFTLSEIPSNGDTVEFEYFYPSGNGIDKDTGYTLGAQSKSITINPEYNTDYIEGGILKLYAKYSNKLHLIKKYNSPISSSNVDNDYYVSKGETYKFSKIASISGYRFLGWDDGGVTTLSSSETLIADGTYYIRKTESDIYKDLDELTVNGHWKPTSVTFYPNTTEISDSFVSEYNYINIAGDTLTLPTLTKEGYVFLGWSDKSDLSQVKYSYTVKEIDKTSFQYNDLKLYAIWKKGSVLKFYNDAGDKITEKYIYENSQDGNTELTYSDPRETRDKQQFVGWKIVGNNIDSETLPPDYVFTYSNIQDYLVNNEVTINAVWEYYKLTLAVDENEIADGSRTVYSYDPAMSSGKLNLPGYKKMNKTGYYLEGWATTESATSANYTSSNSGNSISYYYSYFSNRNVTLYPVWKQSIKFTFKDDTNTVVKYYYPLSGENDNITFNELTRDGYSYNTYIYDGDKEYSSSLTTSVQEIARSNEKLEMVFIPKWEKNLILKIYSDFDTKTLYQEYEVDALNYGVNLPSNENLNKEGLTLRGWSLDGKNIKSELNIGGIQFDSYDNFTTNRDISLYAVYEKSANVTYHFTNNENTSITYPYTHDPDYEFKINLLNFGDQTTGSGRTIVGWKDTSGNYYPAGYGIYIEDFKPSSIDLYEVTETEDIQSATSILFNGSSLRLETGKTYETGGSFRFKVGSDPTVYNIQSFSVPYTGYYNFTK